MKLKVIIYVLEELFDLFILVVKLYFMKIVFECVR